MEINLNNQTKILEEPCSLQQLLLQFVFANSSEGKQKGIAVAVNNTVIPKVNWPGHFLKHKDDVLIIKATQGG